MTHPNANPIPHLIDAIYSLTLALRVMDAPCRDDAHEAALRQDSSEHLSEAEDLVRLIAQRLSSNESGT